VSARFLTTPSGVQALRATLAAARTLYEVVARHDGPSWRRASASVPFDWDVAPPLDGIKRFFFPPSETLLAWHDGAVREAHAPVAPFALFGVPACDATALAYQDRFFARDPYYARRRRQAIVVGVSCLSACRSGFCSAVEAGPFARDGCDLALTRLGEEVVVAIGSPAGERVLHDAQIDRRPLGDRDAATLAAAESRARASFADRPPVRRGIARLGSPAAGDAVGDDEWQQLGPLCFACTGCTNVCPTCSCFSVHDTVRGSDGERLRCWDSCLLEGFQREASGHHPAPRPGDRVRRFWTHKLGGEHVPEMGRVGCVGCGRCDVACPGSIGATRVLSTLGSKP
jgi:hypothetical protein